MLSLLDPLRIDLHATPQLNLEQYLGLWSIEETVFLQQWELLGRLDLLAHMQSAVVKQAADSARLPDSNIVQIAIRGTMTKSGSSLSDAGSTIRVRQEVRAARRDPNVDAVLFVVDTPGGTVAGTSELAQDIWDLSQEKPTATFVQDMLASAGLMAFSQVRKVYANTPGAIVGSMGTYFGMYDRSGEAEQKGIRPVLIRTGDLKGSGFDGLEISDAVKAMWQAVVDENQNGFVAAIQRSRKPTAEQMAELSRGGVYSALAATSLGLVDGIRSYEAVVAELRGMIPKKKGSKMSDSQDNKPRAASLNELKAVCDGADASFLLAQLEQDVTVEAAQKAWSRQQAATILDLNQKLTASQAETVAAKAAHDTEVAALKATHATELAKVKSGGKFAPLPEQSGGQGGDESTVSAKDRWAKAKAELVAKGKTAADAVQILAATNVELHQAYLAECNAKV